jgi:hypothetical protein
MIEPTTETVVSFDSDEAAHLTTVTGWMSRRGIFYGDNERGARYDGCTHKPCADCGELIPRDSLIYCRSCLGTRDAARYAEMPRQEWDGVTPLVIYRSDKYFFDEDELDEYCAENSVTREELPLIICEPVKPRLVSALDLCEDALIEDAEESDIPAPIREAVEQLNKAIKECGALSWTEGKYAARFLTSEGQQ